MITISRNPNRLPVASLIFYSLFGLGALYSVFAAVQGPSGILRRVQIESETAELIGERDALRAEVEHMANLTRRLSDDYLDLDLLDERARAMLGLARADEAIAP